MTTSEIITARNEIANLALAGDARYSFDPIGDGEGYLRWVMSYRHPRLAGGQVIRVSGCSHLLWRDKVYRHRDYFDAGALLYEHLPVLGRVIAWLKRRMG